VPVFTPIGAQRLLNHAPAELLPAGEKSKNPHNPIDTSRPAERIEIVNPPMTSMKAIVIRTKNVCVAAS
jgi:hypothetical protein